MADVVVPGVVGGVVATNSNKWISSLFTLGIILGTEPRETTITDFKKLKTSEQSDKIILRKINEQQNKFKAIENDYNLVS